MKKAQNVEAANAILAQMFQIRPHGQGTTCYPYITGGLQSIVMNLMHEISVSKQKEVLQALETLSKNHNEFILSCEGK